MLPTNRIVLAVGVLSLVKRKDRNENNLKSSKASSVRNSDIRGRSVEVEKSSPSLQENEPTPALKSNLKRVEGVSRKVEIHQAITLKSQSTDRRSPQRTERARPRFRKAEKRRKR
jgi:hypothetical protein